MNQPTEAILEFAPAITLTKTADASGLSSPAKAGDEVRYTFSVRNTGNTPLLNVTVADDMPGLIWDNLTPVAQLAIGAASPVGQFTAHYVLTQADIEAGIVENTATASGKWGVADADVVTGDDTETVSALAQPRMTVVKTANDTALRDPAVPGDLITYSFVVTNTGNVELRNLVLTDDLVGLVPQPAGSFTIGTLPPAQAGGNSVTLTATYAITQDDIDAGKVDNEANVAGVSSPGNSPIEVTSNLVSVPVAQDPRMRVTKVLSSLGSPALAGQKVEWTLTIENIGNTRLTIGTITEPLANTTVSAPLVAQLAPGESTTAVASHVMSQAEIDSGQLLNQVTVAGTVPGSLTEFPDTPSGNNDPGGPNTKQTVTELPPVPSIALRKTLTTDVSAAMMPGDEIEFEFTIRNTGNVTLNRIVLTDDLAGVVLKDDILTGFSLAPAVEQTLTGTYTLTAADIEAGGLVNTATVDAYDPSGEPVTDESGTEFSTDVPTPIELLRSPEISLVKTVSNAPAGPLAAGSVISYAFEITNTGNVALQDIELEDLVSGVTVIGSRAAVLEVAGVDRTSFTGRYTLSQADVDAGLFTNTAQVTAEGKGRDGALEEVTDTDVEELQILPAPALSIVKLADNSAIQTPTALGDEILYSFVVTNTGTVTLTDVTVSDPLPGLIFDGSDTISSLAPGTANAVTLTASYRVTQDDIDFGRVRNTASVTGTYFDISTGTPKATPPVSSELIEVLLNPDARIDLVKRIVSGPTPGAAAGAVVTYGFTVTNLGNVTLTDVVLTESLAGATVSGGPITLAPLAVNGDAFTATYTLTQDDIERGEVNNRAVANGNWGTHPQGGGKVSDSSGNTTGTNEDTSLTLEQEPLIELTKSASISGFADQAAPAPGDVIRYSFVVRNTGNVRLTGITLEDLGITFDAPIAPFPLEPQASRTFTDVGGYALTLGDINAGTYQNTASVEGSYGADGPNPGKVTDSSTVDTPLEPAPGIDLVKTIDTVNSVLSTPMQAGDVVHYDFTLLNTGNVTLTDLELEDLLSGVTLTGSLASLEPGLPNSTAFSATYTLTQSDIDRGSVINTATATGTWGEDPDGVPLTVSDDSGTATGNNDDTELTITPVTGLEVVKSAVSALQARPAVGDLVTYTFVVTNTGNVTLQNVALADPLPGLTFVVGSNPVIGTLEPGVANAVTLTATYALRQQEIEDGEIVNTAQISGDFTDPKTNLIEDAGGPSNTVTVPVSRQPELTVVKTALSSISAVAAVGERIDYTFTVTNTGNVLLENVILTDPLAGISTGSFNLGSMEPGDELTRTANYLITQADIDSGSVVNQALAVGETGGTPHDFPSGPDPSGPGETIVPVPQNATIELLKTADATRLNNPAVIGEEIRYYFIVTNRSNVTLRDVVVSDPLIGLTPGSFSIGVMNPGDDIMVGPAIYAITQADITAEQVSNRAVVNGVYGPPGAPEPISASSKTETGADQPTVTPVGGVPAIALVKALDPALDPASLRLGDEVSWVFTVTNTGNVPLIDVGVIETLAGARVTGGPISLAPGMSDSLSFRARYNVTQADLDAGFILNQAIATGTFNGSQVPPTVSDLSGNSVTSDDPTRTPLTQPAAIDLVKTADLSGLSTPPTAGDVIGYSFTVTNTGLVTLSNVVITDPMTGLVLSGAAIPSLAPGASNGTAYTARYVLTQADINSDRVIENQATATGDYTDGDGNPRDVSDLSGTSSGSDDPTTVTPQRLPGLTLTKTADVSRISTTAQVGEEILYSFTLQNTGNVTLTDVTVADPLPGLVFSDNPVASLAPGASATVTALYALTVEDIRAASRENTATASGTWQPDTGPAVTVPSGPASVSVPLGYPEIAFEISVGDLRDLNGDGIMGPGDQVVYRFEVHNTGTVPLNDVNLDLSSLSLPLPGLVCAPITLAVGERAVLVCTGAAYTITERDLQRGEIVLDGDATGISAAGVIARASSSALTVPMIGRGGVTLEKLAGVETAMIGDLVPYTIRISNAAEGVPVTARLVDTLPAGFSYRAGSARLDGTAVTPEESGRRIELADVTVQPGQTRELVLQALVGSSVKPGAHTNRVRLISPVSGADIAPEAKATIRVLADAVMQCATVLGRVFDDTDQNGHMSEAAEERGLPNVRLVAPNGLAINTDEHGRFNVPCAALPRAIGSNFMLKLDERTLPAGYRVTTENPRVVRLTPGMITRLDFGATMARLVRIDLAAQGFDGGKMRPELEAGLQKLVDSIRNTPTMLRITYLLGKDEAESLGRQRIRQVERGLRQIWPGTGAYKLNIETLIQRAGVAE